MQIGGVVGVSLDPLSSFIMYLGVTICCACSLISTSSAALLMCDPGNITCPDNPVRCRCRGSNRINWRVTFSNGSEVYSSLCSMNSPNAVIANSMNGVTGLLCNITEGPLVNGFPSTMVTSEVDVTLSENVTVMCTDSSTMPDTTILWRVGKYNYCVRLVKWLQLAPHAYSNLRKPGGTVLGKCMVTEEASSPKASKINGGQSRASSKLTTMGMSLPPTRRTSKLHEDYVDINFETRSMLLGHTMECLVLKCWDLRLSIHGCKEGLCLPPFVLNEHATSNNNYE